MEGGNWEAQAEADGMIENQTKEGQLTQGQINQADNSFLSRYAYTSSSIRAGSPLSENETSPHRALLIPGRVHFQAFSFCLTGGLI